ncbi:MAG: cytochrome c biogenesis protein CcsA [Pirellulaceae bacterium]|jgi:hypothetical protein|nr:cytochrome c biogenesis protein CcsA [Pirellulaceae bacterium]
MLSGVSILCFTASYAVTLTLEVSRLWLRLPVRWLLMIGFAAAGLVAHTIYLAMLARADVQRGSGTPLSHWTDWCLLAAWVLAVVYLRLAVRRRENAVGIFLLPLVLALIGAGYAVREHPPFARAQALSYWSVLHGVLLLAGTVAAALALAVGIMYLLQSDRLKRKLPPRPGFRLPTLEWLHKFNRRAMLTATFLITLGLLAGIVLNFIRQAGHHRTVSWTDPVVLWSLVLLLWLTAEAVLERRYRPAREGRSVAYATVASCLLLGLVLWLVLAGQHGIRAGGDPLGSVESPPARAAAGGFG